MAMLRCFRTEQFGSPTKGRRYPYSGKLRQELSGAQWLELTPVLSQMDTPDDVDDAADLDSEAADANRDGPADSSSADGGGSAVADESQETIPGGQRSPDRHSDKHPDLRSPAALPSSWLSTQTVPAPAQAPAAIHSDMLFLVPASEPALADDSQKSIPCGQSSPTCQDPYGSPGSVGMQHAEVDLSVPLDECVDVDEDGFPLIFQECCDSGTAKCSSYSDGLPSFEALLQSSSPTPASQGSPEGITPVSKQRKIFAK